MSSVAASVQRPAITRFGMKLFVTTPTKFWNTDPNVSWNIQTDEMVRGVYTLDYPWTTNGVVLISYTWGDDSALKYLPWGERVAIVSPNASRFLISLFGVSAFGRALVPVNFRLNAEEIRYIFEHSITVTHADGAGREPPLPRHRSQRSR